MLNVCKSMIKPLGSLLNSQVLTIHQLCRRPQSPRLLIGQVPSSSNNNKAELEEEAKVPTKERLLLAHNMALAQMSKVLGRALRHHRLLLAMRRSRLIGGISAARTPTAMASAAG